MIIIICLARFQTLILTHRSLSFCLVRVQEEACNTHPCSVDCSVSSWGAWTPCSRSCGGGTQSRSRTVIEEAQNDGFECPPTYALQACNEEDCPADCVLSEWGEWNSCCQGTRKRFREIVIEPTPDGRACPPEIAQVEPSSCLFSVLFGSLLVH